MRRLIISSVKSVGFRSEPHSASTIKIITNDTPLHNQIVDHRIAMLPIYISNVEKFDADDYEFILDVSNNTNVIRDITTQDFKIKRISTNKFLSETETLKIFPPNELTGDFPFITILRPKYYTPLKFNNDQMKEMQTTFSKENSESIRLHVTCKAVISSGSENAHFNPSCCACFINKVDEEKAKIAEDDYVRQHNNFTDYHKLTPYDEEKLRQKFRVSEKSRFYHTNDRDEPNQFVFKIESVGVVPPFVIFHQSIKILIDKLNTFISNLKSKNTNYINIEPSNQLLNGFNIHIVDENETLGNIVQSYLSLQYCDYLLEEKNKKLKFISYKKKHPLDNILIITIQLYNNDIDGAINTIITPGIQNIIKILNKMSSEVENNKLFIDEVKSLV